MVTLRRLDADEARMELAGAGEIHWCQGEPTTEDLVVLGIAADGTPTWLIVDEEGDCVGMCGTHEPLLFGSTPEIGYHVVPAARRQGVASSAVALLLDELRAAPTTSSSREKQLNVVVVGDGDYEFAAADATTTDADLLKTVRFLQRPRPSQIVAQLELLETRISQVVYSRANLKIEMTRRKREEMEAESVAEPTDGAA